MTGTVGIVMLVHTAFRRAEQLARHWVAGGCPVVIHMDARVSEQKFDGLREALSDLEDVRFCKRFPCEWGTWGLVAATQAAASLMLERFPDVRHVYLASGSCLPLRPVADLRAYLDERPNTDFIESATTADVPWTVDGLDKERFTLRFPFSWKRQRRMFDWYVDFQRRWGMKRKIPAGLTPHMGSQWWCLTRQTLSAIMQDPNRPRYDRYFKRVWIPDESYFQSLARLYARNIESRSLTLSKFDFQGKPHIFYDDHLQLLRRSDCFVARKIWPQANRLYDTFLQGPEAVSAQAEPNPGHIDRIFAKAVLRRTRGRPGLYMHSRFPNDSWENGLTAGPYSVFEGFSELFIDFEDWLARATGLKVHGHLFAPNQVEFESRQSCYVGALSDNAQIRDFEPTSFLRSLIWNTRGERQCFQYGPNDSAKISPELAKDANASISVISGAWAVPLSRMNRNFSQLRVLAAELQQIEAEHLKLLRSPLCKARVRIWTMAEFVENPMEHMQAIVDDISTHGLRRPAEAPRMADLSGFGQFLQNLKNQGMHPYLMGDFPVTDHAPRPHEPPRKPYLVR